MHTENSILMRAPLERVFETAAALAEWPAILPHYRYVRVLERSADRTVLRMAARRGWIPVAWTSELQVDRERHELRFHHLSAITRGMVVVWTFTPTTDGVLVRIRHDLAPRIPLIGRFVAEHIIGSFFIAAVATRTLASMKQHLEAGRGA